MASAIAASVPDPGVFEWDATSGVARVDATAELERRQEKLARHHRRRPIPAKDAVVGCTSALRVAGNARRARRWIAALRARKPERFVAVALAKQAGKNMLGDHDTGEVFRQEIFAKAERDGRSSSRLKELASPTRCGERRRPKNREDNREIVRSVSSPR